MDSDLKLMLVSNALTPIGQMLRNGNGVQRHLNKPFPFQQLSTVTVSMISGI